jgi:hypothetical protein
MKTRQLTLEVSESLFQKLEKLSELTEEPINELVIQMITNNIIIKSLRDNVEQVKLTKTKNRSPPNSIHGSAWAA